MKCVKCGFEQEVEGPGICGRCGAVQTKAIKGLEAKKVELGEKIDKILVDLKKRWPGTSSMTKNPKKL